MTPLVVIAKGVAWAFVFLGAALAGAFAEDVLDRTPKDDGVGKLSAAFALLAIFILATVAAFGVWAR